MNIKHETHFYFIIYCTKQPLADRRMLIVEPNLDFWRRRKELLYWFYCFMQMNVNVTSWISLLQLWSHLAYMGYRLPKHPLRFGQADQRWANNSVFEYYSNTWGRILVFVFVFGWLLETEYYSYSYSCDFLKPNIIRIRIRVIFSNRILFVFVFGWFSQTE